MITKQITNIYMSIEGISLGLLIKHGSLALFWAIVHALSDHRSWKSKSFLDFIILIIMSSFTWVMFTLLALHTIPDSPYLIYAMSWTWWYLWIEWMSVLVGYLKNKIK